MNKEFIPYEQALDLESIGFDIRPDFGNQTSLYTKDGRHLFYTNYGVMGSGLYDGYIYAPTFSQAFRWFREKYNIKGHIEAVEYLDGTPDTYHWSIFNKCNSGYDQLTYEEAELECLRKLIEVTKTK